MTCADPTCEKCYPRDAALRTDLATLRAIVTDLAAISFLPYIGGTLDALVDRARQATEETS